MTTLTPPEVLQALLDGKQVRWRYKHSEKWNFLDDYEITFKDIICGKIEFSLIQERVTIGDVSFPKPVSEPLKKGTKYWFAGLGSERCALSYYWADDETDKRILHRGLLHLSEENAIAHAKALIKLSRETADE